MKFRSTLNAANLTALMFVLTLASCKKDITTTNNDSGAATLSDSSTSADNKYYDVLNNAFVASSDNESVWNVSGARSGRTAVNGVNGEVPKLGCAIYAFDNNEPGVYPKTLTLNFGTGCVSADGVTRKGKLIYLFDNPLFSPGSTVSVTFENYVVNGYGLKGTYSISNKSSELIGIQFTTQVTNGIVTYPDNTNYHYSHNKIFTMTSGLATPADISDDVYAITGNSAFSNSSGASIVFTTTTPLVKAVACPNTSGGIVSFTYNDKVKGNIDFGNGDCDNLATITVGTISRTITLR